MKGQEKKFHTLKEWIAKKGKILAAYITWMYLMAVPVYAGDLKSSKLYTGTIKLLNDVKTILLAVEAVLVIVLMIWKGIQMQAAEDEEKPKYKKAMKNVLILGIIIVALTATIPLVLKYYA